MRVHNAPLGQLFFPNAAIFSLNSHLDGGTLAWLSGTLASFGRGVNLERVAPVFLSAEGLLRDRASESTLVRALVESFAWAAPVVELHPIFRTCRTRSARLRHFKGED
jgi:hypothetical protein